MGMGLSLLSVGIRSVLRVEYSRTAALPREEPPLSCQWGRCHHKAAKLIVCRKSRSVLDIASEFRVLVYFFSVSL